MAVNDDYALVCLCQKGDSSAFGLLVERHQKKMMNIAYRLTGDYDGACEVVQDAFVSAFKAIGKFRREAAFSTWLYRIAINLSKNRMKQMKTRLQRGVPPAKDCFTTDEGQVGIDPADPAPSVLEQLEKREVQEKVQACINALDHEYREGLVLRDIQGFSYDEIKALLDVPEGTVKSRLFRARDTLKGLLKEALGDLR